MSDTVHATLEEVRKAAAALNKLDLITSVVIVAVYDDKKGESGTLYEWLGKFDSAMAGLDVARYQMLREMVGR